jgi:threonyl-tRNA synthetase
MDFFRVRELTQDDSHVFEKDHIEEEITRLIKMVQEYYSTSGSNEVLPFHQTDDFMGEIKVWDKAEDDLRNVLKKLDINSG